VKARTRWHYLAAAPAILRDALLRGRYEFTLDLMPLRADLMPPRKRLNLVMAGLNLVYRRSRPWSWPIEMGIELTTACNLRCPVCPIGAGVFERTGQVMDLAMLEELMREAGPYLLQTCLWGWGEPLLAPHFARAVGIVRRRGVLPIMSTNGQNLDHDDVQQGLTEEPPEYLIVALDGLTNETFQSNRPGARLEPALEGVRRLARMKRQRRQAVPVLHMRYIVTAHNQHEVPDVVSFARAHEFDMVSFRTLSIIDTDESAHRRQVARAEEFRSYDYDRGRRVRRRDFVCEQAFIGPTVFADGSVVPCVQDFNASYAFGQIGPGGSFGDIWFGERAAEVRHTIKTAPEEFTVCGRCPRADRVSRTTVKAFDLRRRGPDGAPVRIRQRPPR
jgi:MoaA/NifB/PqqE/SkfB family radical SAM enzyme